MTDHLLSWLIFLPLAAALLTLTVKRSRAGAVASLGALLTFGLAAWALVAFPSRPDLRTAFAAEGGLLEQALDRALARDHTPDVVVRGRFLELLREGVGTPARAERATRQLAGVPEALGNVANLKALSTPDPKRLAQAYQALETSLREAEALQRTLLRVEREVAGLRSAARGSQRTAFRLAEHRAWLPGLDNQYFLAVDGLSLALVVLTALLALLCLGHTVLSEGERDREAVRRRCVLLLLTEGGLLGVLCSLDLILFFVFWVLVLFPAWFLFGGGRDSPGATAGARFFLPAFVGALVMLLAFLALYVHSGGPRTFNVLALVEVARGGGFSFRMQGVLFACLFLGCAVRLPLFPLHGWLPAAQGHVPAGSAAFLQGAVVSAGGYGLFRLAWPLCPEVVTTRGVVIALGTLGLVNIVYGALVAMAQRDLRRTVACASVSAMGYLLVGLCALTPASVAGAALELIAHGLAATGASLAASVLVARTREADLGALGGLIQPLPRLGGLTALLLLCLIGFPGLVGFVSKLLVFLGAWSSAHLPRELVAGALAGVALGGIGLAWTFFRLYLGELIRTDLARLRDLSTWEGAVLLPLVVACLLIGCVPHLVLDPLIPALDSFLGLLPAS